MNGKKWALIDALKLDLTTESYSRMSATDQKAREEAIVRTYGTVADFLQQKKLSHEINKVKINNEIEQTRLLLNGNFPELHGQVLARTKFEQDKKLTQLQNSQMVTGHYWLSLARQGMEQGAIRLISSFGELAAVALWKDAGLGQVFVQTISEHLTKNGNKNRLDRKFIENQNEIKTAMVFVSGALDQVKFEQQQEAKLQAQLKENANKLKATQDPALQKEYEDEIKKYALQQADSQIARYDAQQTAELGLKAVRKCNKKANKIVRKRYGKPSDTMSKDRKKAAEEIAQKYLALAAQAKQPVETSKSAPVSFDVPPFITPSA